MWRPIVHEPPLCTLRELQDGTYTINDLADMHEVMSAIAENNARYRDKQKEQDGRK